MKKFDIREINGIRCVHLAGIADWARGYYATLDADKALQVISTKTKNPRVIAGTRNSRGERVFQFSNNRYKWPVLLKRIETYVDEVRVELANRARNAVTINHNKPIDARESYMIATMTDGEVIHFWNPENPWCFRLESDARKKMDELARADLGRRFVLLQFKASCVAGEPAWI